MRGPKPPEVEVSGEERSELERLVRGHTTGQQLVLRANVILAAADGLNNTQVARTCGIAAKTARQWRARWRAVRGVPLEEVGVVERLADAPRSGAPARIGPEQVCQIIALVRGGAAADLRGVLAEAAVAHIVQAALDPPVPAQQP